MRIISGIYSGMKINGVEGYTARPTSDFVREMLFSTLYSLDIKADNVLDLYAGSGALGFEALSRGASEITFVDGSKKSISTIISNSIILKCQDKCKIVLKKVENYLGVRSSEFGVRNSELPPPCSLRSGGGRGGQFDLIFADPPYNKGLVNETIRMIFEKEILAKDGIIIIEHSKTEPIEDELKEFVFKEKKTATIVVSFIKKTGNAGILPAK